LIKAKINGVSGNFILDTGASNSCVDLKALSYSCSQQKRLRQKLPGATGMFTQTASNNKLQLEFGKIHHSI
jgi:predicted aspartyl protease